MSTSIQGTPWTIDRPGPTHLHYTLSPPGAAEKPHLVGIRESATHLRIIPHLGQDSWLLFPTQQFVCPAQSELRVVLLAPLCLEVGVGSLEGGFKSLGVFLPARSSRALYGPVDSGTLCRAIHTEVHRTMAEVPGEVAHDSREIRGPQALMNLSVRNNTTEVLEVSKVMIPPTILGLYAQEERVHTSLVSMQLLSAQSAEIHAQFPPKVNSLTDIQGRPLLGQSKITLFTHSYKTKTGLDFGF